MATVQFVECVLPLHAVPDALGCGFLQYAVAKDKAKKTDVDGLAGGSTPAAARDWFGVISFESNLSTLYVFRANIAAHPPTTKPSASGQRFGTN